VIGVLDLEQAWAGLTVDGHHVAVIAPSDDIADQLTALSPARVVVNLMAPGALEAVAALRAGGSTARFWGCVADAMTDRALGLGMIEPAARPIDPDAIVEILGRYAVRGTRVVTAGADVDALMSLRQALARRGLSVSMAWDAKQAGDLLHVVRPEVVVVDLGLPRRDGFGIVARFAAADPAPSAVLIPGDDDMPSAFAATLADPAHAGRILTLGQLLGAVLGRSEAPPVEKRHHPRVRAAVGRK
jgi:CheY-like chemotaxis protein